MKKFAILMALVVAAVFCAQAVLAADIPAGKEKLTINFIQKEKVAVQFAHKDHADRIKDCQKCHHKGEAGKEEKCSNCHKDKAEKVDGKDKPEFKKAMHDQCKKCHEKEAKANENAKKVVEKKCEACHPKAAK
jgi:hypothetical protein